jgi:hypothetical protein
MKNLMEWIKAIGAGFINFFIPGKNGKITPKNKMTSFPKGTSGNENISKNTSEKKEPVLNPHLFDVTQTGQIIKESTENEEISKGIDKFKEPEKRYGTSVSKTKNTSGKKYRKPQPKKAEAKKRPPRVKSKIERAK